MNDLFEVKTLELDILFRYPTTQLDTDNTVRIEVPGQYYGPDGIKALIKFLKKAKRDLKTARGQ